MFDLLSYEIALWELQREKYKIGKWHSRIRDKSIKEDKSQDKIKSLAFAEMDELKHIDELIAQIQHRLLWKQAEKFLIPTGKYMISGAE